MRAFPGDRSALLQRLRRWHNDPLQSRIAAEHVQDIRAFARAMLPEYMVPSLLLVVPSIPIGANGKADLNALPLPAAGPAPAGATDTVRPGLETTVAKCWSTLLGRPISSRYADFFDVGGHSLLAVRLVARLGDELGVSIPLRFVFDARSIADQAAALRDLMSPVRPLRSP